MGSKDDRDYSIEATVDFERDLEELIFTAYARGAAIEGTWHIDVPVADAPNWSVSVDKIDTDDESTYDPDFIDD